MSDHAKLAKQRQAAILQSLRQSGGVRVAELVVQFGVSDMTVRRDLDVLVRQGIVEKVHGGAVLTRSGTADEPSFAIKASLSRPEKEAIAARAAELVEPDTAIGLSGGTTVYALAAKIVDVPRLTVVTNSVPVAELLFRDGRKDQTIIVSGGIRTPSDALVGPVAVQSVRSLNLNQVFLGVHGMSAKAGFTTPNQLEAEVDKAMVQSSPRLNVLADHTKWGIVGLCTIAPLEFATTLITDDGLSPQDQEAVSTQVGEVVSVALDAVPPSRPSAADPERAGCVVEAVHSAPC